MGTIRAIEVVGARPLSVSNSRESIRHVLRNRVTELAPDLSVAWRAQFDANYPNGQPFLSLVSASATTFTRIA